MKKNQQYVLEENLAVSELRDSLGPTLDKVQYQDMKFVIERRGKPVVAIVPLDIYEGWKEDREKLFALIQKAQSGNQKLKPEDVMSVVTEAQVAVREHQR